MDNPEISTGAPVAAVPTRPTIPRLRGLRRFVKHHALGVVGICVLLAWLIATSVGPSLLPHGSPNELSDALLASPRSPGHFLGTDELGRDQATRLLHGARVSLLVGVLAAIVATLVGGFVGAVSGFFGRTVDGVSMRFSEFFQVMPAFILAAVIVTIAGSGVAKVTLVIALLAWPQPARLMRGQVLKVKQYEYVDATRCLGLPEWKILLREVVPNSVTPMIALMPLIAGQAILIEAGLGFLGLTSPDTVSWGGMLAQGQRLLFEAWWLSVFPGVAILVTVVAFNLVGDALNDVLNPQRAK